MGSTRGKLPQVLKGVLNMVLFSLIAKMGGDLIIRRYPKGNGTEGEGMVRVKGSYVFNLNDDVSTNVIKRDYTTSKNKKGVQEMM